MSGKEIFLRVIGLLFCTVPPLVAILLYFPLWKKEGGAAALSGFALLLILVALVPLFNTLKLLLRSPASYTLWLIVFIAFLLLSKIAEEMTVISFVGFVGNVIGAFFLRRSGLKSDKKDGTN